jgi:two-component system, NarL family, sensor histidine kinase DesK
MTLSVAVPRPRDLSLRIIDRAGTVAELRGRARDYAWFVRVATVGAVVYAVYPPFNDVTLILTYWSPGQWDGLWALIGTAAYLPLHLRHVWYAAHGTQPPGGRWTLAVVAVVVIGVLPFAGEAWLRAFGSLAVSAGIVLRPRWARPTVAVLVLLPLVLALVWIPRLGDAWWVGIQPANRALVLIALIWLAAGVRQLQTARLLLAEQAVARERSRIDADLQRTLGVALESIVTRGERAATRAGTGGAALGPDLRELVDGSRHTLAEARRMIRGYQQVSLQAELDTAATLLTAAGIETTVLPFTGRLDPRTEESARDALRGATARLLRDGTVRSCVVSVTRDGLLRLDVQVGGDARVGAS